MVSRRGRGTRAGDPLAPEEFQVEVRRRVDRVDDRGMAVDARVTREVRGLKTQRRALDARLTEEVTGLHGQRHGLTTTVDGLYDNLGARGRPTPRRSRVA